MPGPPNPAGPFVDVRRRSPLPAAASGNNSGICRIADTPKRPYLLGFQLLSARYWEFQTISPVSASSASVELWYRCFLSIPPSMNFGAGDVTDVPM